MHDRTPGESVRTRRGPRFAGRLIATMLAVPAVVGAVVQDRTPMSFEVAFSHRQFLWDEPPAVSPDGQMVAYSARQQPADMNLDARLQANGVPSSVVGSRVYISEASGGDPVDICPTGGSCWRPSWSPDGSAVAFYSDAGGYPQLWVHAVSAGNTRRVSDARIKAKLWAGDHARWSPDGATLYVPLSPDQSPDGDFSTISGGGRAAVANAAPGAATVTVLRSGALTQPEDAAPASAGQDFMTFENNAAMAAIDAASGQVRELVAAESLPRPSVLRLSPTGRWLSYLSVFQAAGLTSQESTYDLAVVPATGGATHTVASDLPVGQDYHNQNYSWHPHEDRLAYLKDRRLWLVEFAADGSSAPRQLGADLGDLSPEPIRFTRSGDAIVVGTDLIDRQDYRGEQPQGIALVPLDGSAPRRHAFGDDWIYRAVLKADETTVWQPVAGSVHVLLRHARTGESAVVRYSAQSEAGEELWRGIARLRGFGSGADQSTILATYEDIGTPADIYRFDAHFGGRSRVSRIEERFEGVGAATAEVFEAWVPLFDGQLGKVRTSVILPPGAKRGDRLPGIVMLYPGGDSSRDVEEFGGGSSVTVPPMLFVSRGYAVILVNLTLGPNGQAGNPLQEMVDVLLPQVYRAAELGYVDVSRLGVTGQSFGGYGTASIISGTNLFRAAVAISGIYDLGGTYGYLGPGFTSFWIGWSEGGQARMGTHPWANVARYLDNSPYYQADKIHTPLLLLHGDQDMAYHDAQKLFTALRRLERPAELAIYHGQGHVVFDWSLANAVDAAQRMVRFFDDHLKIPN